MNINGIYTGLGATVRIGLGFIPSRVRCVAIGNAALTEVLWDRNQARTATGAGGIVRVGVANVPAFALLTAVAGIRGYAGGDVVATATRANQILGTEVAGWSGDLRGAANLWTLGSSGNRTGNINAGLATTYCGVGSAIQIKGKMYTILALTNDGDAANEITLDRAAPTGPVEYIGCKVDFAPAPVGTRMPAGIEILDTTHVNVDATPYSIEAYE
jgi:hypothetical protein